MAPKLGYSGHPPIQKLPDGRKRIVRETPVSFPSTGVALVDTEVFKAWGTADEEFTNLLLVDQDIKVTANNEGDQSILVQVFEELHPTNETQVGKTRRILGPDNIAYYEADFLQLSSATQVAANAVIGVLAAPGVSHTLCVYEEARDNGAIRQITRRYQTVGNGSSGAASLVEIGGLEVDNPLAPLMPTALVLRQRYRQRRADYVYPSENAVCPYAGYTSGSSTAYFCHDSPRKDVGGGIVEWVRTWATVPASFNDYDTRSVVYPAFLQSRERAPFSCTVQLVHDFYLVGAGSTYANAGAIPVVSATRATFLSGGSYPIYSGATFWLNNGGAGVDTSSPSVAAYMAMATTDKTNTSSYSIDVLDSSLRRYEGNIWCRLRVKAKAA